MTDLRDKIAAVIYNTSDEYARKLMVRPDCPGASDMEGSGKPVCYVLADAVIAALPELTQPVSVEAIGDYRYVCHPCGSSFSFYSSSTMQQFALMHSGSHTPKDADD